MRAKNSSTIVNEYFFSKWTQESAYVLGLLEADGYIKNNTITYSAAEKDKEHVSNIHKLFNTDVTISESIWKTFKKYRFSVTASRLIKDIQKVGFRTGQIPIIPKRLMRHWLRGLFDGDGSVYLEKDRKYISIVFSNKNLADSTLELIRNKIGFSKGMKVYKKKHAECWYFRIATQTLVSKFAAWIYKDSTIALQRKQKILSER